MSRVSVFVPSRNEKFLNETVADLLRNATGDVEVIVVFDGYWANPMPAEDKRIKYIHRGKARGLRDAINSAACIATGEFYLKVDAHCAFGLGYDEILKADCAENWIVIPRRYSLDAENWVRKDDRSPIDAMYYFYPFLHPDDLGLHGRPWREKAAERLDVEIDEDLTFQGSAWFMAADHFHKRLGGLDENGYETFMGEPQELGFKTQLGEWAGKIMRNKKTWYAHLHKGKQYGRMYSMSQSERIRGNAFSFDFWWNNRWEHRKINIQSILARFMPMPGWIEDWLEVHFEGKI